MSALNFRTISYLSGLDENTMSLAFSMFQTFPYLCDTGLVPENLQGLTSLFPPSKSLSIGSVTQAFSQYGFVGVKKEVSKSTV